MGAPEVRGGGLTGSFESRIYDVVSAYVVVVDSSYAKGVNSGDMSWVLEDDGSRTR
jgi:hypothetical protein